MIDLKIYRYIIFASLLFFANIHLFGLTSSRISQPGISSESVNVYESDTRKTSQQPDISYSIEPFYDIDVFRLIVVLEFTGDRSGETKIILPNNFASSSDINGIKFLKPLSPNTYIQESDKPETKIVKHTPNTLVRIYYQVEEVRDDDLELGNQNMAIISKQYVHFLGETFFIVPSWDTGIELNIRIVWNHIPSNWNIANSFGINEKSQEIKLPLWKFKRSLFAAGDFRIIKKMIGNNPVYTAIRSSWDFTDDQFADLYSEITKTERDFWNDHNFPYFLITVVQLTGSDDQIGIGRTNSYALFLSKNRTIDLRS